MNSDMRKWDNRHKWMTIRLIGIILLIAAIAIYKAKSGAADPTTSTPAVTESTAEVVTTASASEEKTAEPTTAKPTEASKTTAAKTTAEKTTTAEPTTAEKTTKATQAPTQATGEEKITVTEDGTYTDKEHVALYIHEYGKLPSNFITKKEAEALGWPGGDLNKYAKGKSIGGTYFGNYEGLLPTKKGRKYYECDIDYKGGKRGEKRLIYSNDGLIFYTEDHYETFTQLY